MSNHHSPLVPAKAGTQSQEREVLFFDFLDSRLRGNERNLGQAR
jgi:hypothetical protein